jgi:SAM-dependent methyltransferase
MIDYYDRRAPFYEAIYRREEPARRAELEAIAAELRRRMAGRRVLDVACGTGFWTAVYAAEAEEVVGVDASPAMLAEARAKRLPPNVRLVTGDAYELSAIDGEFDAAVATFWISHVPRERVVRFLDALHLRVRPGSIVFMADNVFEPGIGGELVQIVGDANTYKRRTLPDGSIHDVVKNYYTPEDLARLLPGARDLEIHAGTFYTWFTYAVGWGDRRGGDVDRGA